MSLNFYIYVGGDSFPVEAWQSIMDVCNSHPLQKSPTSPWRWQWMTESRVWVTVGSMANPPTRGPAWAEWCVTLDFSTTPLAPRFDATAIVALALVELPRSAPGVRVQGMDGLDDASADSIDAWGKIALGYLDQESVDAIVEWASSA